MHTLPILVDHLVFHWPDGTAVFDDVTTSFGPGRTGLVGTNGAGKSTLLRLIAGELTPDSGTISTSGAIGFLRQRVAPDPTSTVADLLGVREELDALRSIEAGSTDPADFDRLGDAWDVEERIEVALDSVGLGSAGSGGIDADRPVSQVSGGEAVLIALAGLRHAQATPVTLLDEPTNNLDQSARARLYAQIATWPGTVLVVSHDRALLDLMDQTAEVRDQTVTTFGGTYSAWRQHVEVEQAAVAQALRTAEQDLALQRRQRQEAETRIARSNRRGKLAAVRREQPKIVLGARKRAAQVSAGKLRGDLDDRVDGARADVEKHRSRVRLDPTIHIDLPDPQVATSRRIAEFTDGSRTHFLQGPERLAITGRNGIGKTRLLATLLAPQPTAPVHAVAHTDRIGVLTQRLDNLGDDDTILATVRAASPHVPPGEVRARLARFGFRGDEVLRPVATVSGGERFRVALARLLLAEPAHQLLVLDEPTNNLDSDSVTALVSALSSYRGALVVVSHDDEFLAAVGVDRRLTLTEAGLAEG